MTDGSYNFTISRLLDTGDSNNFKIVVGQPFDLIWAHDTSPTLTYHGSDNFGFAKATIVDGGPDPDPTPKPTPPLSAVWDVYDWHGWIMWISWFLLGFV